MQPVQAGLTQVIRAGQVAYSINLFFGKKENDALALAWAQQFCADGAVLDRNFALIGPGDSNGGEVGSPAYKSCPLPAQDSREDGAVPDCNIAFVGHGDTNGGEVSIRKFECSRPAGVSRYRDCCCEDGAALDRSFALIWRPVTQTFARYGSVGSAAPGMSAFVLISSSAETASCWTATLRSWCPSTPTAAAMWVRGSDFSRY